jgi:hypothetical protein
LCRGRPGPGGRQAHRGTGQNEYERYQPNHMANLV